MDKNVTVRFFRVSDKPQEVDDFPDLLISAVAQGQAGQRERMLDGGISFRLERCEADGDFVSGDFCRKQTANIPPEAKADGLAKVNLSNGGGLGHMAAFRYHRPTRVLLLQHNLLCGSTTRVSSYVAAANPAALFNLKPVLRKDAMERFQNKQVRSFEVTFSSPANLEVLDQENVAAATGAKLLAEAYEGLSVTITVGVGKKRKKRLNLAAVSETIDKLLGSNSDYTSVKVDTGTQEADRFIDFVEEHMKESRTLDLDGDNPANNYAVRKAYLQQTFNAQLAYLLQLYGNQDGNHG